MIGPNGIGKSNLLEAVELLGSLRSHRCSQDRDLIQWDAPRALLRAGRDDGDQLELELRRQGGRQARRTVPQQRSSNTRGWEVAPCFRRANPIHPSINQSSTHLGSVELHEAALAEHERDEVMVDLKEERTREG